MRILVTGANGFVGRGVVSILSALGHSVCSLVRDKSDHVAGSDRCICADLCSPEMDILTMLSGVDIVVHLAARTLAPKPEASDPMEGLRNINIEATRRLALAAAKVGVTRFVFMSSVKVNGEMTGVMGRPEIFRAGDVPHPEDAYGQSKLEAELALQAVARETGLEVVIVRPPLVYGPGVHGNFLRLMRLVSSGFPLPLGALHNRRSLISLGNLTDLVVRCITHPSAPNNIIMAADGEDLSTTQLLRRLAKVMNLPLRLIPVPAPLLELGFTLLGQRHVSQRLCRSLQVDISKTRELLEWAPPLSVDDGLYRTVEDYQQGKTDFTPHSAF